MHRRERAVDAIRTAENAVAALVSEAGQDHNWDEASAFIDVGRRLRSLVDELSDGHAPKPNNSAADAKAAPPAATGVTMPTPKVSKKAVYPQFFKEGDALVKIGWSKSQRNEYEHKSPRSVIDAMVASLLSVGSKGQRFVMEKVLPLRGADNNGAEFPEYQAYVCLAWLRHEGLIKQYGRSGYSIPKASELAKSAGNCWERLRSR